MWSFIPRKIEVIAPVVGLSILAAACSQFSTMRTLLPTTLPAANPTTVSVATISLTITPTPDADRP